MGKFMTHLLRIGRLLADKYPLSRSTLYLEIARGKFVPPIYLGARAVAWRENEVDAVIAARTASLSDGEVSNMIVRLVAARPAFDSVATQHEIVRRAIGGRK